MANPISRLSTPQPQSTPLNPIAHPAYTLLTRAHPTSQSTQIFTDKILHKPLLLTTTPTDARSARRHIRLHRQRYHLSHTRPRPLSAQLRRELGLYDLKPSECRYEVFKELNGLWNEYVMEVLGVSRGDGRKGNVQSWGAVMGSADYHGMEVEVVRSRDSNSVGIKGIVVRETKGCFIVISDGREMRWRKTANSAKALDGSEEQSRGVEESRDKVRTILKKGTVFRVVVKVPLATPVSSESTNAASIGAMTEPDARPDPGVTISDDPESGCDTPRERRITFDLYGDQLEIRSVDRATKKFKWRAIHDLKV